MSQGKKIQVSCDTSVMNVSTSGRALRLGVNGREMGVRHHLAHQPAGLAGVDEVIDDQQALAGAAAEFCHFGRNALQNLQIALLGVVVTGDADGIDDANAEFARDDGRRHQPAAGDRDDGMKRPDLVEPPGQRPAIPVKLVPRDRKGFAGPFLRAQFRIRQVASSIAVTSPRQFPKFEPAASPLISDPASISLTAFIAAASFSGSRERTTRLVFGFFSSS